MCGIAALWGEAADRGALARMIAVQGHRGPDSVGHYVDNGIALGAARLAIIGRQAGPQPVANEDGQVQVAFNGEIYNWRALRQELEGLGHRFATATDTEVLAHGYEAWGVEMLQRLHGMFAFGIWDGRNRQLFAARDRFGIKPLHWAVHDGMLVLASELKALVGVVRERRLDRLAFAAHLALGYLPGGRTLLRGFHKLPPAHALLADAVTGPLRPKLWRYYNAPRPRVGAAAPSGKALASLLREAVSSQLEAEVPLGCYLSGGLDTSTIAYFAAEARRLQGGTLDTFTMGFGDATDEFADAQVVAEHLGTRHHALTVEASDMVKALPEMVWHADAPKFNLYPWFVHRLAKRHATVCLSGLGGDEVFGGYASSNRYRYAGRFMAVSRAWPPFRAAGMVLQGAGMGTSRLAVALAATGDPVEEYLALTDYLPAAQMRRLVGTTEAHEWIHATFAPHFGWQAEDLRDLIMEAEFYTKLPDDFLAVDDAMSMAHSLEVRVPLLDDGLVDPMRRVPYAALADGDVGKLPLRDAMAPYLPRRCFEKPKWGFSVNLQAWFAAELGEEVRRVVPESPWVREVCDMTTVSEWCRQRSQSPRLPFRWGTKPSEAVLWMLLAYHHWAERFLGESN